MHSFKKKYKLTKRKTARETDNYWLHSNGLWAQLQSEPSYRTITRDHVEAAVDYVFSSPRRVGRTIASAAAAENLQTLFEEEVRRQANEQLERRRRELVDQWSRIREGQHIEYPMSPLEAHRFTESDRLLAQALSYQAARPRVNPDDRARGNTPSQIYGTPF